MGLFSYNTLRLAETRLSPSGAAAWDTWPLPRVSQAARAILTFRYRLIGNSWT